MVEVAIRGPELINGNRNELNRALEPRFQPCVIPIVRESNFQHDLLNNIMIRDSSFNIEEMELWT